MKKIIIGLLTTFLVVSCVQTTNLPANNNAHDLKNCEEACLTLDKLNCEESKPIPLFVKCTSPADCQSMQSCVSGFCNVTCLSFCMSTQNAGVDLGLLCVSKIKSCDEIETCGPERK